MRWLAVTLGFLLIGCATLTTPKYISFGEQYPQYRFVPKLGECIMVDNDPSQVMCNIAEWRVGDKYGAKDGVMIEYDNFTDEDFDGTADFFMAFAITQDDRFVSYPITTFAEYSRWIAMLKEDGFTPYRKKADLKNKRNENTKIESRQKVGI